ATAIHGNKSQSARTNALAAFKAGRVRVLVATDIAARGIDVDSISHVINYDMPAEPESYVHRIGRTARYGNDGDAISFCCARERDYLRAIERFIRTRVPVDDRHRFHCQVSMNATGADARTAPRGRRNSNRVSVRPHDSRRQRGGKRPSRRRSRRPVS
ncbi:unnamed protein product, partial [marine sediment metagenome]